MKKRILLLTTAAFLFTGFSFAQTPKDSTATTAAKTRVKEKKPMPVSCPGKSCGKKKA